MGLQNRPQKSGRLFDGSKINVINNGIKTFLKSVVTIFKKAPSVGIIYTPNPTPTQTATPPVTPSHTPTPNPTPSNTPSNTVTPSVTKSPTTTPTQTKTQPVTKTPTKSPTTTPTNTKTPPLTQSPTATPPVTKSPTPSHTATQTPTASITATPTQTPTLTRTPTTTPTNTKTQTQTQTQTRTQTQTQTQTRTQTQSQTVTRTQTQTQTQTPTITRTPTLTPTITRTQTQTPTITRTPTLTPTNTQTQTQTPTNTQTQTKTPIACYCWELINNSDSTVTYVKRDCNNVFYPDEKSLPYSSTYFCASEVSSSDANIVLPVALGPCADLVACPPFTQTATPTFTTTPTVTPSNTVTRTNTPSVTATNTLTPTTTPTNTASLTPSPTNTASLTPTNTETPTLTPTTTVTATQTLTPTKTTTQTQTPTITPTGTCSKPGGLTQISLTQRWYTGPDCGEGTTWNITGLDNVLACLNYNNQFQSALSPCTEAIAVFVTSFVVDAAVYDLAGTSCRCTLQDGYYWTNALNNLSDVNKTDGINIVYIVGCKIKSIDFCAGPPPTNTPTNTPTITPTSEACSCIVVNMFIIGEGIFTIALNQGPILYFGQPYWTGFSPGGNEMTIYYNPGFPRWEFYANGFYIESYLSPPTNCPQSSSWVNNNPDKFIIYSTDAQVCLTPTPTQTPTITPTSVNCDCLTLVLSDGFGTEITFSLTISGYGAFGEPKYFAESGITNNGTKYPKSTQIYYQAGLGWVIVTSSIMIASMPGAPTDCPATLLTNNGYTFQNNIGLFPYSLTSGPCPSPTPTPTYTSSPTPSCEKPAGLGSFVVVTKVWASFNDFLNNNIAGLIADLTLFSPSQTCDIYMGPGYNGGYVNNPSWYLETTNINIPDMIVPWDPANNLSYLVQKRPTIYFAGSSSCACQFPSGSFMMNYNDGTQAPTTSSGIIALSISLCKVNGGVYCGAVVPNDPSPTPTTTPTLTPTQTSPAIQLLSQPGQTMEIGFSKSNSDDTTSGTINWGDGFVDSYLAVSPGTSISLTHTYSQQLTAYWVPFWNPIFSTTAYAFTFRGISGFSSSPITLQGVPLIGVLLFQFCYFNSLSNILLPNVTSSFIINVHQVPLEIRSGTLPQNGMSNNKAVLLEIVFGGVTTGNGRRAGGTASGQITMIDLDLTQYTNLSIIHINNNAQLTSVNLTLQTTLTRNTISYPYPTQDDGYVDLGAFSNENWAYLLQIANNPNLTSLNLTNNNSQLANLSQANPTSNVYVIIDFSNNNLSGAYTTNVPTRCQLLLLYSNSFTSINCQFPSGTDLVVVKVSNNQITTINSSIQNSTGLKTLWAGNNRIINLPSILPNSIEDLRVNNNSNGTNGNATQRMSTLPTLPQNLKTLVLGVSQSELTNTYGRCEFTNFFTTGAGRPSNYLTNTTLTSFLAPNCGITEINLDFPNTIRTIDLGNSAINATLSGAQNVRSNTITTFDFSKCAGLETIRLNNNTFLTSCTNLSSVSSSLKNLIINNCYNNTIGNLQSIFDIFGAGNGLSIVPNLLLLNISDNNILDIQSGSFNFGGLLSDNVEINLMGCGLSSSEIDYIITNLYNNYYNVGTGTRIRSGWTIKLGNPSTSADIETNCPRTSASNTAFNALTNTATAGAWTIQLCGTGVATNGGGPCATGC